MVIFDQKDSKIVYINIPFAITLLIILLFLLLLLFRQGIFKNIIALLNSHKSYRLKIKLLKYSSTAYN